MATKKKAAVVAPAQVAGVTDMALLMQIAVASAGIGYMHVNLQAAQALGDLVEINGDPQYALNGDPNTPAVRISPKGTEILSTQTATPAASPAVPAAVVSAAAANYAIAQFELPAAKRIGGTGGARPEKFPFSKLELGAAFFIPATPEVPEPAKKFASTVASASLRYSHEDTSQPAKPNRKGNLAHPVVYDRKFAIRAIDDGAPFGQPGVKGAAVGRIPV